MRKSLYIILTLSFSLSIYATEFEVKDGDTISVNLSQRDLSKISIKGGRLLHVKGLGANYKIEKDDEKGELYIIPKITAPATSSFFVMDEFENTYNLITTRMDIPAQNVVLIPKTKKTAQFKAIPISKRIKSLVRDIVIDSGGDFTKEVKGVGVKLWKEADVTHEASFIQDDLVGDKYLLKNVSNQKMVLDEKEFSNLGEKVLAISIVKPSLEKDESTIVIVIRRL